MKLMLRIGMLGVFTIGLAETHEKVCPPRKHDNRVKVVIKMGPSVHLFANICCKKFTEEQILASEARHQARIISAFESK